MIIWITQIRKVVCALCMLMTAAEEEWFLVLDTMHCSLVHHSREPKFLSALSKVKRSCITEREKIKRKVALFKMGNCQ